MRVPIVVMGTVLLAGMVVHAQNGPTEATSEPAVAFARLKTLVGEWEAETTMGKSRVTYELVSGGTAILERDSSEKMPTMVTMYHLDGDRLLLTHYCVAGNQPRMQARGFDANAGALKFEFLDATNLASSAAGHMRSVAIRFVDANHVTAEWQFYENGRPTFIETARYSRVR